MEKFSDFISEQKNQKPYRLLTVVYDTPDDPNKTGALLMKQAKKMGIDCYEFDVAKGYTSVNKKGNIRNVIRCPYHSWSYDFKGNLVATPHIGGLNNHQHKKFDKAKSHLKEVRIILI